MVSWSSIEDDNMAFIKSQTKKTTPVLGAIFDETFLRSNPSAMSVIGNQLPDVLPKYQLWISLTMVTQ